MFKRCVIGFLSLALLAFALPALANAQISVGVSIRVGPPAIPVYTQPVCPGPGYIWTPGYWGYGADGYYWVPGTWVVAPVGMLWTPGYWGWNEGVFVWHAGYWGPHVGFYGGVNYGFGYSGVGFVGGRWDRGVFAYNTAVTRVDVTMVHTTYVDRTVIVNNTNHVSFNGGPGGLSTRPDPAEVAAERDHHVAMTAAQEQHEHAASTNRALLASENHGRPAIAATARPGEFQGRGVVGARGANGPANNAGGNRENMNSRPANNENRPQARPQNNAQPHPNNAAGQHTQPKPKNQPQHEKENREDRK